MQQRATNVGPQTAYLHTETVEPVCRTAWRVLQNSSPSSPQHKSYTLCELWSVGVYHSSVPFRTAVHDVLYKMEQFLATNSYTRRERDDESCDQETENLWKLSTILMFAVLKLVSFCEKIDIYFILMVYTIYSCILMVKFSAIAETSDQQK